MESKNTEMDVGKFIALIWEVVTAQGELIAAVTPKERPSGEVIELYRKMVQATLGLRGFMESDTAPCTAALAALNSIKESL